MHISKEGFAVTVSETRSWNSKDYNHQETEVQQNQSLGWLTGLAPHKETAFAPVPLPMSETEPRASQAIQSMAYVPAFPRVGLINKSFLKAPAMATQGKLSSRDWFTKTMRLHLKQCPKSSGRPHDLSRSQMPMLSKLDWGILSFFVTLPKLKTNRIYEYLGSVGCHLPLVSM